MFIEIGNIGIDVGFLGLGVLVIISLVGYFEFVIFVKYLSDVE